VKSFLTDKNLLVQDGANFSLANYSTNYSGSITSDKEAEKLLVNANKEMAKLQNKLYATDNHSVLLVFQAMDAAGKDSTIRSVFSGVNPTGFQVSSFKAPSKNELDHDFLWRCNLALPERGRIGIFNRSHYEEVLVCKVHPEYVLGQNIPSIKTLNDIDEHFWQMRYKSIRNWEKHLAASGTLILKFFLNVSKDEQKARFLSRIEETKKNWKFSFGDLKERARWYDYMNAYQDAITNTADEDAPWYIIPADNKPIMRAMVASIVAEALSKLNIKYPSVGQKELEEMKQAKEILENES